MRESSCFSLVRSCAVLLRSLSRFFQYRWLLLADDSCMDALPVKLYTNSQQENLER